jgi:DNA-binding HxlR family transcriptional regulator
MPCPVQTSISVIGGKWKPGILYRFRDRTMRLSEMRREMPWVSEAVLVRMLRELEADGLISRHDHGTWPRRVDYALTEYGKTVIPVLDAIASWGDGPYRAERRGGGGLGPHSHSSAPFFHS